MRILDDLNNEIFEYNKNTHYLIEDTILIAHHDEIPEVKEEGHYEIIAEYNNGGKDVKWIVDIPKQEYKPAWDEYENVLRLMPFSKNELHNAELMELLRHHTEKMYNTDRVKVLEQEIEKLKAMLNMLLNKE